jgi:transposase InsO family protein
VFFLQDKSETQGTLKCFLRRAQNEFELKVKKIRSDNGSEFKNLQVEEFLEEEGIKHEFSAPYTPQQNGVVERKNRTLIDMTRTMLGEFKTPECFWSEVVNTACHAINRVYLHRLCRCFGSDRTPGVAPQGVFRSRTVSTTVAKWFMPVARGTVDNVYRFGPLRDA